MNLSRVLYGTYFLVYLTRYSYKKKYVKCNNSMTHTSSNFTLYKHNHRQTYLLLFNNLKWKQQQQRRTLKIHFNNIYFTTIVGRYYKSVCLYIMLYYCIFTCFLSGYTPTYTIQIQYTYIVKVYRQLVCFLN